MQHTSFSFLVFPIHVTISAMKVNKYYILPLYQNIDCRVLDIILVLSCHGTKTFFHWPQMTFTATGNISNLLLIMLHPHTKYEVEPPCTIWVYKRVYKQLISPTSKDRSTPPHTVSSAYTCNNHYCTYIPTSYCTLAGIKKLNNKFSHIKCYKMYTKR